MNKLDVRNLPNSDMENGMPAQNNNYNNYQNNQNFNNNFTGNNYQNIPQNNTQNKSFYDNGNNIMNQNSFTPYPRQTNDYNNQPFINQSIYSDSYSGDYLKKNAINLGIDNITRSTLKSRGIAMTRSGSGQNITQGYNNNSTGNAGGFIMDRVNSQQDFLEQQKDRKKALMDNMQEQLSMSRKTKLEEKKRSWEEDQKYLSDMVNNFPFGKGGGGAPIRDKNGNIVTARRALVSDPRYNLVSINVDDDYYDVQGRNKNFGLMNFKYQDNLNISGEYPNGIGRGTSARRPISNMGNNNMNMNNNMGGNNFSQTQQYNNNYQMQNMNMGMNMNGNTMPNRPYSTRPNYNNNMNYNDNNMNNNMNFNNNMNNNMNMNNMNNMNNNNFQMMNEPIQGMENYPQQGYPDNTYRNQNVENADINLSYDNYEIDEEAKQRNKQIYRNDLLNQIEEKRLRQKMEKEKKAREDAEEEERIKRENEELQRKLEEENRRKMGLKEDIIKANNSLVEVKVKEKKDNTNNNTTKPEVSNVSMANSGLTVEEQNALGVMSQKELEGRMQLNNEILRLRDQMQEQQMNLFNQITSLKQETQSANIQRYEALKEIEKLKDELSKQRADEELRRKYVYDVITDNASTIGGPFSETHLPDTQVEKVVLPVDKPDDMFHETKIRNPNKILPIPRLDELKEGQVQSDSKFIDLDTHNVIPGLELYQPHINTSASIENEKLNNKGYQVDGDFGTLRSYYQSDFPAGSQSVNYMPGNNDKNYVGKSEKSGLDGMYLDEGKNNELRDPNEIQSKFNKDVKVNISDNINNLEDGVVEVNDIYTKNLERLRALNDYEGKLNSLEFNNDLKNSLTGMDMYDKSKETAGGYGKENYDDFINKINGTCKLNY